MGVFPKVANELSDHDIVQWSDGINVLDTEKVSDSSVVTLDSESDFSDVKGLAIFGVAQSGDVPPNILIEEISMDDESEQGLAFKS